eukprot:366387-Chlamydomonas_euryale.AAC.23
MAQLLFSMCPHAAETERSFSLFWDIHSKRRACLSSDSIISQWTQPEGHGAADYSDQYNAQAAAAVATANGVRVPMGAWQAAADAHMQSEAEKQAKAP